MNTRYCMLYEFQLGSNKRAAICHTCAALGEGHVADRTCPD